MHYCFQYPSLLNNPHSTLPPNTTVPLPSLTYHPRQAKITFKVNYITYPE